MGSRRERAERVDLGCAAGWACVLLVCTFCWAAVVTGIASVAGPDEEPPRAAAEQTRLASASGPEACAAGSSRVASR